MKDIIESIKIYLPESSVKISDILEELLEEIELVMEHFLSEGYLPDQLNDIYEELQNITEEMKLGYGQLNLLGDIPSRKMNKNERPNYEDYVVDNTIEHTLLENFTYIKPHGFMFLDKELIEAKSWKSLYIKACEIFLKLDENIFLYFENKTYMNGQTRSYFSKEKDNMDQPIKLLNKIYISTGFGANEFRDILIKILKEYNYDVRDFKVYFRADYNPLHLDEIVY